MQISSVMQNAIKLVKRNSPEILTAVGVVGVAATAVLSAKAAFKAKEVIDEEREKRADNQWPDISAKEQVALVWKIYTPPIVVGAVTMGCIIGARNASASKTTAAVAAYSITEKAFSEYKERVIEQIGVNKEQAIRDQIVQDKIEKNPPQAKEIIYVGKGDVLCCDLHTRRYFKSDMESLRKAQNNINARINSDIYVMLTEFYDQIGLPPTSHSDEFGWDSDRLLELEFTTALSEGGEPCIAFDFNYLKPL